MNEKLIKGIAKHLSAYIMVLITIFFAAFALLLPSVPILTFFFIVSHIMLIAALCLFRWTELLKEGGGAGAVLRLLLGMAIFLGCWYKGMMYLAAIWGVYSLCYALFVLAFSWPDWPEGEKNDKERS